MPRTAVALLVGTLLLSPVLAAGGEVRSLEQIVVEMAEAPADHAALAEYYHAKAEQARADMRRHDAMGRAYARGKQRSGGAGYHCKKLSEQSGQMANDYDALAKLHEAEAKSAE